MKKILFDLDGCLCTQLYTDYRDAQPFPEAIKVVNAFYDEGHTI